MRAYLLRKRTKSRLSYTSKQQTAAPCAERTDLQLEQTTRDGLANDFQIYVFGQLLSMELESRGQKSDQSTGASEDPL
jgi:hypothetical protein